MGSAQHSSVKMMRERADTSDQFDSERYHSNIEYLDNNSQNAITLMDVRNRAESVSLKLDATARRRRHRSLTMENLHCYEFIQ